MNDFDVLTDAALDRLDGGDTLPALMLCDFLSENDDARGERLRRRVRDYERRLQAALDCVAWFQAHRPGEAIRFRYRGEGSIAHPGTWLGIRIEHERQSLRSYIFRLMSARGHEPVPPERVTAGGYFVVRPGE